MFCFILVNPIFAEAIFEVESANIDQSVGNYYLSATLNYQLNAEAEEILSKGLPIRIRFELEINKPRRYWFDKNLLEKEYEYVLLHNPITDQFNLTRLDTDSTLSYATSSDAIDSLHYLTNLLVGDTQTMQTGETTQARLRMILDVRNFPEPMQYLSQYWGDWVQRSRWHTWPLNVDTVQGSLAEENQEPLAQETLTLEDSDNTEQADE